MQLSLFRQWSWKAWIEGVRGSVPHADQHDARADRADPPDARRRGAGDGGNPSSAHLQDELPPYVAYRGDGDVAAPAVYVNYGMPDD